MLASVFFFTDTATTEIYPLSLHDALPISAFRTLERRLHPSTTAYAVVGKDLARRFERIGVPRTKLHVVRSGVRLPLKSYAGRREQLRDRLGLPRSRKLLAYVGSLEPRKNVLDLVPLLRDGLDAAPARPFRSEERRVGKECRTRWSW